MVDTTTTRSVVSLRPRRAATALAIVASVLVGTSVALNMVKLVVGNDRVDWLVDMFRLNREQNIPAYFSGILFILSAVLLAWVWGVNRDAHSPRHSTWLVLSLLFLFLAYDELFAVHELLMGPMRERFDLPEMLRFAWIPVYLVMAAVVGLAFWPLERAMDARLKRWFAAAALTYLTGAVVLEMAGGAFYTGAEGNVVYGLLYTVEESLEMAGAIMLVYALLSLLEGSALSVGDSTTAPAPEEVSGWPILNENVGSGVQSSM